MFILNKRSFFNYSLILSVCLAGVFFLAHCAQEKKSSSSLAPDFKLKTLDGQEIILSQFIGKVVLIDFWATWCGPCRQAIPHLIQLYKNYEKDGLEVIGISLDKGDEVVVHRFAQSLDIPYPIAMASEEVVRKYKVMKIPTCVLIDKEGRIRENIIGFNQSVAQQLTSKIADLTSKKP